MRDYTAPRNTDTKLKEDGTKMCMCCRQVLDATMFFKNRSKVDGLDGYCKKCRKHANMKSRANKE